MAKKTKLIPAPAPEVTTPTIEERMAELDARLKKQIAEEKKKFAMGYLTEARARMKGLLAKTTDVALKAAVEEVRKLERMVGEGGSGASEDVGTRVRRSVEELQADATAIVSYLKAHPGSKSSAVMEATGITIKPPLNVKTFVTKYVPGVKVKVEGMKAGTTYSIG
jgi:hypothetical protein